MPLYKREVHFVDKNGQIIGLDVLSTTLFMADALVKEVFLSRGVESRQDIITRLLKAGYKQKASEKAIDELLKVGLLSNNLAFSRDESEDQVQNDILGGISLNISHACNMSCSYCFGGGGSYGGPATIMPWDIASKAIEYLYSHCGNRKECMIGFFGGEPFINWEVLKQSILYSEKLATTHGIRTVYFITTNATLITREHLRFLDDYEVKLVVSIDGPEHIHNRERRTKSGKGTYQTVKEKIQLIAEFPKIAVQARPTITPFTSGLAPNIYHHLIDDLGITRVHARPQSTYEEKRGLNSQETAEFLSGLDNVMNWVISEARHTRFIGIINVLKYMNILYHRVTRHYGCGAGTSVLSIAPDGSVFPCPRFTGENNFLLGNITSSIYDSRRLQFFQNGVMRRIGCRDCWARHVCGGGCYYMHWKKHGIIELNDDAWCTLTKGQIELAMSVYAQILGLPDMGQWFFSQFTPNLPSDFTEEK